MWYNKAFLSYLISSQAPTKLILQSIKLSSRVIARHRVFFFFKYTDETKEAWNGMGTEKGLSKYTTLRPYSKLRILATYSF